MSCWICCDLIYRDVSVNQIKDLPPSLFQNLQNLKQLWEPHSVLYYLWCKLCLKLLVLSLKAIQFFSWGPSVEQYCSVIYLYLCWSAQLFIDWLKASLDEVTGLMNHRSILWILSITILLFVCVCYRNISNNPLEHIYSNQFDSLVNLQSLWVNRSKNNINYVIIMIQCIKRELVIHVCMMFAEIYIIITRHSHLVHDYLSQHVNDLRLLIKE